MWGFLKGLPTQLYKLLDPSPGKVGIFLLSSLGCLEPGDKEEDFPVVLFPGQALVIFALNFHEIRSLCLMHKGDWSLGAASSSPALAQGSP